MPAFTTYTRADRERALALRAAGVPRQRVSRDLNISQPTLLKWEREAAGLIPASLTADDIAKPEASNRGPVENPDEKDPGNRIDTYGIERAKFLADLDRALEERFRRLSQEPAAFDFYRDRLGDPPMRRSALWQKLTAKGGDHANG